jgi:hypothetical protein
MIAILTASTASSCPEHIKPNHWQEWLDSGIDSSIITHNIESLAGHWALEALLYAAIPDHGHNRHYITAAAARLFDSYDFATQGGWWVSGVDPLQDWQRMQWGQFKPDRPRLDLQKSGKVRKYEAPLKTPTRIFLLVPSPKLAEQVYQRYGIHPTADDRAIGFWHTVWKYNLPIILCEGAKKAACLLTLGYAAIALPGVTGGVRSKDDQGNPMPPKLIPDLQVFATAGRDVYICFDYETKPSTVQNIEREIEKLNRCYNQAKCKTRIISLPGPQKGVDDFVVAQGGEAFHAIYQSALNFEHWQTRRYSRLTYPISLELNQRYLGNLPIPTDAKLIILKSPKGTGKTESFVELVAEATRNGQRTLLISHRVQLAQAICDRVGIPFLTEVRTSETRDLLGYGLCVDSLHPQSQARFNADDWHDALILIDESEQVVWHTLSALTEINNRRIPVLQELKKLITGVLASDNGRIVLSDADMSNVSLEFIWGLAESRIEPWIALNQYQPAEPWTIHHYVQKKPDQLLAALHAQIQSGGKPFIVTQSQKRKSRWSTTTLEHILNRKYPDHKWLRIDSETIADPTHPAYNCTAHLNEILLDYDGVITSPLIETGVSIDIKGHFTSVWGFLLGVTPENSARQSLARVRDAVDRHIWIAPHGFGRVGNGSTSVKSILSGEYQLARLNAKLLDFVDVGEEMITAHAVAMQTWAKMACRINAGLLNYRDTIISNLHQEGHVVLVATPNHPTEDVLQEVNDTRLEQHQAECQAIAQAEDITQAQYEELKGKRSKSLADAYKERKYALKSRYQSEVTPELVAKDDDGWYPKIRLYYYLTIGRPFLQDRDRQNYEAIAQTGGVWLPTLNRSQLCLRILILEKLGIKHLLNPDRDFYGGTKKLEYQNADAHLLSIASIAKQNAWRLRITLGVSISDKHTPIEIAQILLSKLGLKLSFDRQEGGKGNRQRVYRYIPPRDDRDEILSGWFTRDELSRTESAMHTPGITNSIPSREGSAA